MKTIVLLLSVAFMSMGTITKAPGIRNVTVEIRYYGRALPDTFTIVNARSPICIASYKNGESCLVSGRDSVITCNVSDYKVLRVE
jgi:hypothetical protein